MILQTRYFCLDNEESGSGDVKENNVVREISLDEYRARTTPWSQTGVPYTPLKIIHAHEVAFAPKGDPTSNFSVWFDEEPIKLEQTQIKRSRRMKQVSLTLTGSHVITLSWKSYRNLSHPTSFTLELTEEQNQHQERTHTRKC